MYYILYHFVCSIKNRKKVLWTKKRQGDLKAICNEIEENYEMHFLEVWSDVDHVYFLLQWVLEDSSKNIIQKTKSLSWRYLFQENPELRKELLWWKFWTSWYYVNTVWRYGSEEMIRNYVKDREKKRLMNRFINHSWHWCNTLLSKIRWYLVSLLRGELF